MNDAQNQIHTAARRCVDRLLDEYDSAEEFRRRPGGADDPMRAKMGKMRFGPKDFSGVRPGGQPPTEPEDEDGGELAGPRGPRRPVPVRFEDKAAIASAPGAVKRKKAGGSAPTGGGIKGGKSAGGGEMIASKPGKVGYKGEEVECTCHWSDGKHAPWCKCTKKDSDCEETPEKKEESYARRMLGQITSGR